MGRSVGRVSYVSICSLYSLPLLSLAVTVPDCGIVPVSREMNRLRYALDLDERFVLLCDCLTCDCSI